MPVLDMRYLSPHAQEELRVRVIRTVRTGMSQAEAARVFGVSRRSVNSWDQCQRTEGLKALRARQRGRPRILCLKPYQAATVVGRKRPRTQGELIGNVRRFLWSTQHRPQKVQSYFLGPHVRYAA
jgi:transposase